MKWVTMWGNAQSKTMPSPATYAKDLTLRYPIFIPFNGNKIKITLDNYCQNEKVKIDNVIVSIGSSLSDKQNNEYKELTFNGKPGAIIDAHGYIISDELNIDLKSDEYLIVSLYIKDYTNLTGGVDITGPLSKGYFAYGNQATLDKLDINTSKSTTWVYFLSNIDIYTDDNNEAIICYGDSITSQDWPDYMLLSLRERNINNISIIRKAVSGTRILRQYECITYQSYGLKGENRFIHEISGVKSANTIIVQHGINDIIHPVGEDVNIFRPMSDLPTADELIEGINYYKNNSNNLNFIVGTLLPIYNWRTYKDFRETLKNEFNDKLINNYDFIDFEKEIGEIIDNAWHFKDGCDSGDHLHPSKYAYKLMGILAANKIINMKYKFYGYESNSVFPINKDYKLGDQRDLYDVLTNAWSKETCAPRLQDNWNKDNKTLGQCSITAFLVQDIYGGDVYGIPLADGNFHCFNKIGDVIFDLTSEQFKDKLDYTNVVLQSRDNHFKKKEKYNRYLLLKDKLNNLLNNRK